MYLAHDIPQKLGNTRGITIFSNPDHHPKMQADDNIISILNQFGKVTGTSPLHMVSTNAGGDRAMYRGQSIGIHGKCRIVLQCSRMNCCEITVTIKS